MSKNLLFHGGQRGMPMARTVVCAVILAALCLTTVMAVAPLAVAQTLPPHINLLTPAEGPVGSLVVIDGYSFGDDHRWVDFNGTPAPNIYNWENESITVEVPGGATDGDVVVTTDNGDSNGVFFDVSEAPQPGAPHINFTIPTQGQVGTPVTINGYDFGVDMGNSLVVFNGVPAYDYYAWSDSNIATSVPAGATSGDVQVITQKGASNGVEFTVTQGPQPGAPYINFVLPTQGPVGTTVEINGLNFGEEQGNSVVTFNGVPATDYTAWGQSNILTEVPAGATSGDVIVITDQGASNGVNFTVTGDVQQIWYLTEGCTGYGFETYVMMENINDETATVSVFYNTQERGRIPRPQAIEIPPNSRTTVSVNEDLVGMEVSVSTEVQSDKDIVCERSMYWDDRIDGHDSIGVTEPRMTWFLSEGCTAYGFETWLLVQNPGQNDASVFVEYMTSDGVVEKDGFVLESGSRASIDVAQDVGECDVSAYVYSSEPICCERSMYWDDRRGGHDSIGTPGGAYNWYLAEGSTAWGFDTYLLLQNPGEEAAQVDLTYMTEDGPVIMPTFEMEPQSRETIFVNKYVEDMDTSIHVESDRQVIAERSMYWDNGTGKAGHDTIGMTSPAQTIYLAEGSTDWGFTTYLCLQNPNNNDIDVTVTYLTNGGPVDGGQVPVAAGERATVCLNDVLPEVDTSIKVEAPAPIMAERPMYWHAKGGGHVSIGWVPGL